MANRSTKTNGTRKQSAPKKYDVMVNKYRKQYGAADFYVGSASTLEEARMLVKKHTRNGDSYAISYAGKDPFYRSNQVERGKVYGSGKDKICREGYTSKF